MVASTKANRVASLVELEPADLRVIGNKTQRRITERWPLSDVRAFSVTRLVAIPGRPWLRAEVRVRLLPEWCEANVVAVSFWSAHEADFWEEQCCLTLDESLACERLALEMV